MMINKYLPPLLLILSIVATTFTMTAKTDVGKEFTNDEGNYTLHFEVLSNNPYTAKLKYVTLDNANKFTSSDKGVITLKNDYYDGFLGTLYKLTEIDKNAFYTQTAYDVRKLIKGIDASTALNLTKIGDYAFRELTNLESFSSPYTLTTIGTGLFYGCTSLTTLNGGTQGDVKFFGLSKSSKYLDNSLGINISNIPDYTFYHCTSLKSMRIRKDATQIGIYAFEGCTSLISDKDASDLEGLGYWEYNNEDQIYYITLGSLPPSLTTISTNAFKDCSNANFKHCFIPNSTVTNIWSSAFAGCTNLERIYSGSTTNYLPSNLTQVSANAFKGTKLANVYIYPKVTTISSAAFENCTSLTSVSGYTGATTIMTSAFQGCNKLTSFDTKNVTEIGTQAFFNCTALKTVTFGSALKTIGQRAFKNCSALESLSFPNSLTKIDVSAFNRTTKVGSVKFGTGLTQIGDSAFYYDNITALTGLEDTKVTTIGKYAFYFNNKIPELHFPSTLTKVDEGAFQLCNGLKIVDCQLVKRDASTVFAANSFLAATARANARLYVPYGYEQSYYSASETSLFAYKPIVGGGTFSMVLENGLIDDAKNYHYLVTTAGEQLHGIDVVGDALLVRDEGETLALNDRGSLEDYPSLEKLIGNGKSYNDYNRNKWVLFKGLNTSDYVDNLLSGSMCVEIVDRNLNPTVKFDSGYDINWTTFDPITAVETIAGGDTYEPNIYCPANFVAQDTYYMVEPIACEYAKIVWAVKDGDGNLYMVKKQQKEGPVYHNSEGLAGGFKIDQTYLTEGAFDEDNAAYEFTAIILHDNNSSLGSPRLKGNVEAEKSAVGNYTVYPIKVEKKINVVTGIEDINAAGASVASVRYYNAAGQVSGKPFEGMNIVVTTFTDGKSATTKILK